MAKVGTRKRGARWQYFFEGAPINGKRRQVVKSGFASEKEAYKAGVMALAEYEGAGSSANGNMSVSDFMDEWVRMYVDANLKLSTKKNYTKIISKQIKPRIGGYRLSSVTPTTVQEMVNALHGEGYSKSYISLVRVVTTTALRYAVKMRYLKDNPAADVVTPKASRKARKREVVPQSAMRAILRRFEGTPHHLPILIGYHTGLRIGEVYGLTWDNVDFQNKTITVDKQINQYKREWYFSPPKTSSSNRTILVGDTLMKALKEAYDAQQAERSELGRFYQETRNLVNAKRGGGFYTTNSFAYVSRIIHNELGFEDFDFHSLRHTHATMLIEAGANIKDVSERLGHTSIETTLQIYTHKTKRMEKETVELFETLAAE